MIQATQELLKKGTRDAEAFVALFEEVSNTKLTEDQKGDVARTVLVLKENDLFIKDVAKIMRAALTMDSVEIFARVHAMLEIGYIMGQRDAASKG